MPPPPLVKAVESAIVASAHLTAYEHLAAANRAVQRLGTVSRGRWRSAARDLQRLEDDLQTSISDVTRDLAAHAETLGIEEEALWAAGDAAATLDVVREPALHLLEADSPAVRLLTGQVVFGVAVVEDPDAPDRGTTLVFSWAEPLAPASWPWQASWISPSPGENGDDNEPGEQLDLYDAGELESGQPMLAALSDQLNADQAQALAALRDAAAAVTRAALLLASGMTDDLEEDEDGAARLSL